MELNKKRGVFFSLDAIIALGIILLTILLAYPFLNEPKPETELQSDIIQSLSSLKIYELDSAYAQGLIADGSLIETNKSVLEALGELYVKNVTQAKLLAEEVLNELETKENIGLWYGNTLLASKNSSAYENAQKVETARQIISGIQEGESVTGFSARAFLQSKRQTKYAYIGGYVGEGNLTIPLEFNGVALGATLEATTSTNFDVYINDNFVGSYQKSPSQTEPQNYTLGVTFFQNGTNNITLRAANLSVAGGFVKLVYLSSVQYKQPVRYHFPGIEGVVNLYDGFYVPGTLTELAISLHYDSAYTSFLTIGNTTVLSNTTTGETTVILTNSELNALLDYDSLSNRSIPIRFGLENLSLIGEGIKDIDVVLITDVSGSMAWRMDNDNNGITRSCTDPLINDPSTRRISLAKCLDRDFVATILNSSVGSRVALVSFSDDANNYVSLTHNQTLLNNTIFSYSTGGATCLSCAINRAYQILEAEGAANRTKFIIAMTDGVTNRRSTESCNDLYGSSGPTNAYIQGSGLNGLLLKRNETTKIWAALPPPASNTLNDIDLLNETLGFAAGANGKILKWNGNVWSNETSPITSTLYRVDVYNGTYALAVGASGRVVRWNGASWSTLATISNAPTIYGINMYNHTLIFASGARSGSGRIFRSSNGGQSWSEIESSTTEYRAVKIINATRAFAVGSGGRIMQWSSGSTWSQVSSGTSENLYGIDSYNRTRVFAVGGNNGKSVAVSYNGASWSSSLNTGGDSLRDVAVLDNAVRAVGEGSTIYERNATAWTKIYTVPPAYGGISTSGVSCTADSDSCTEINSFPGLNANYSSCRARELINATIYSVGFGPIATCGFANQLLQSIALCGNGTFYASSDAEELREFYESIAQDLIRLSYSEQTAKTEGNISARLYPDSYLEFNYTETPTPYGLLLSYEKLFDNSTSATLSLPGNVTVLDLKALSYSGARWTSQLAINQQIVYSLASYGTDFTKRGDPFQIHIPTEYVGPQNNITLVTGLSPTNTSEGSPHNKLVYTLLKNASGYSPIVSVSEGCTWTIDFDSGANLTTRIPGNYSESSVCTYQATGISYNNNDAAQEAVYRLFDSLDLNKDNRVDVEFTEDDLEITLTEVTGIPFTWSTEVQVRAWR